MPHLHLPGMTLWAVPRFRRHASSASASPALEAESGADIQTPSEQVALECYKHNQPHQTGGNAMPLKAS